MLGLSRKTKTKIANENGFDISKAEIVEPANSEYYEEYVKAFYELRKNKGMTIEDAQKQIGKEEKEIRKNAIESVKMQNGLPASTLETEISPDKIVNEMESIKFRMRRKSPLKIRLEREYHEDKESVKIESVMDNDRNDLPVNYFELYLQTWSEDATNWLDTGIFKLHISI